MEVAEQGLGLLVSGVGATLTRNDDLVPCFDIDELKRRNSSLQKGQ